MMSNYSRIFILTLILQFKFALALVVIKSLEPLETPDPIWGLQLIPESVENRNISFIEGVTFCGRFYYHRFPSYSLTLVKMGPQVFFYVLTLFFKEPDKKLKSNFFT